MRQRSAPQGVPGVEAPVAPTGRCTHSARAASTEQPVATRWSCTGRSAGRSYGVLDHLSERSYPKGVPNENLRQNSHAPREQHDP